MLALNPSAPPGSPASLAFLLGPLAPLATGASLMTLNPAAPLGCPAALAFLLNSVAPVGNGIPALTLPIVGAFVGSALRLKTGDFGASLVLQISDASGPVEVSGASSVTLRLRGLYDVADTIHGAASVTATRTGGARNEVAYRLQAGDTLLAGDYAVEVLLVWSDGQARTSNRLVVTILSDVG